MAWSRRMAVLSSIAEAAETRLYGRMPLAGGPHKQILEKVAFMSFDVASSGIYFLPRSHVGASDASICHYSFETGAITDVAEIGTPIHTHISVCPRERFLLYTHIDEVNSDLMLVENFR